MYDVGIVIFAVIEKNALYFGSWFFISFGVVQALIRFSFTPCFFASLSFFMSKLPNHLHPSDPWNAPKELATFHNTRLYGTLDFLCPTSSSSTTTVMEEDETMPTAMDASSSTTSGTSNGNEYNMESFLVEDVGFDYENGGITSISGDTGRILTADCDAAGDEASNSNGDGSGGDDDGSSGTTSSSSAVGGISNSAADPYVVTCTTSSCCYCF